MLTTRSVHLNAAGNCLQPRTPAHNIKSRSENAYRGVNGKGKTNAMRTPFYTKTTQTQRLAKDTPGSVLTKTSVHPVARPYRPLADKTPFVNRTQNGVYTPALDNQALKLNHITPAMHDQQPTSDSGPGSAQLSSTQRACRATKPLVLIQTPANQGNHWDTSDGDIVIPEMEQVLEVEEEFDDSEEIEHMPPNTLGRKFLDSSIGGESDSKILWSYEDLPYHPPFDFDLPNYELLAQAALRNVYSYPSEGPSPPSFDFLFSDKDLIQWDSLSLPSLLSEDESFTLASKGTITRPTSKPTTTDKRSTISRPTSALASSSCITSRPPTASSARRAATSASIKAPTVKLSTAQASTTIRATSATTTCLTSTVYKQPVFSVSRVPPRAPSLAKPLTTDISRTANRAATSIVAKCSTENSANVRPPTSRVTISKPATSISTARPVSSTSIRPHSARARAVIRPQAPTASRATSASETLKKPIAASDTSVHHSSLLRVTNVAGTSTKQATTSNKLRTKSQRTNLIKVNPGCTPDVNGVVPTCNNSAKAAVTHTGNLVLEHDSEQLEQAGHQEKMPLEPNATHLACETQALADDLNDVFVSVGIQESEEGGLGCMSPAQAPAMVNKTIPTIAQDFEI